MIFKINKSFFFLFSGLATNVSVQLLVASMGSINTENMVREYLLQSVNAQSEIFISNMMMKTLVKVVTS